MPSIWISNILDLLCGDPYWFPHPVRFIGAYIKHYDTLLGKEDKSKTYLKLSGIGLTVTTVFLSFIAVFLALRLAMYFDLRVYYVCNILFMYTCLAARCLHGEAFKIRDSLDKGDLELSKKQLSYIVGRDVENLDEDGIIKAVIETVSENTSDGVIAPLFYMFIGGAPLAMAYKAINTLDSMVAYKEGKYKCFGYASARLDDIANYLPSRLTGLFIIVAAFFLKLDYINAFKTMIRDSKKHSSPNSGYPESAAAGALNISLGGDTYYFGKRTEKPLIGYDSKEINSKFIKDIVLLMYGAWIISLIFLSLISLYLSQKGIFIKYIRSS